MSVVSKQLAMPKYTPHSIHLASHGESSREDGHEQGDAAEVVVSVVPHEQQLRPSSPTSECSRKET